MKSILYIVLLTISLITIGCLKSVEETNYRKGNVIFIHPDGCGLSTWQALRILEKGPDGEINWDKLPNIGLYRSHTKNSLTTSSNAGATMHAFGKKVVYHSYGMNGKDGLTALSGKNKSIMMEAKAAGINIGIINSGDIVEPGSGVFVASNPSRYEYEIITEKIINSGAEVILSGGEQWMLPEGVEGKFGPGKRKDGKNLIEQAKELGYTVVFDKYELKDIPSSTGKVLGVFAYEHTFNDKSEEELIELGLPNYFPHAPSVAEMTEAAIRILSAKGGQFFIVTEEEGTDNFGNNNNANGTLEAIKRGDETIGVALDYYKKNQNTLILVTSDSEASGMEVVGFDTDRMKPEVPLAEQSKNWVNFDGANGSGTKPFLSAPDKFGNRFPFGIAWSTTHDTYGSVVARAIGLNAELVKGSVQNTDMYRVMYATLFGKLLDKE